MGTESPTGAPGGGGFDINAINKNDLGVMIAGVVAFIASFLPYYSVSAGPFEESTSAWHSYATLGLLLIFAAVAIIAVKTFAASAIPGNLPVGLHVVAAALAGLGTLLVILRAFTIDSPDLPGIDAGVGWGAWVLFIAGIAVTVFAVLGMRESGEKIPDFRGGGSTPPPPSAP